MTSNSYHPILNSVSNYYSAKLLQHGETPQGVDWNGAEGQLLRFDQLCRIIDPSHRFSLLDFGCGYGALFDYLQSSHSDFSYLGLDVSSDMIAAAVKRNKASTAQFICGSEPSQQSDYAVASGVFNVRLDQSDLEWQGYIEATLVTLNAASRKGFSFNCLTAYSDADRKKPYLFYADPCYFFDLCKKKYSRNVALLHDYGLYEFTILVRKP